MKSKFVKIAEKLSSRTAAEGRIVDISSQVLPKLNELFSEDEYDEAYDFLMDSMVSGDYVEFNPDTETSREESFVFGLEWDGPVYHFEFDTGYRHSFYLGERGKNELLAALEREPVRQVVED
jgi:hypothetical protein